MSVTTHLQAIGQQGHQLAMRELKPLSGLAPEEHDDFWNAWTAISARRRIEIAQAMSELAEENVDLDFGEAQIWMLNDDDAQVRASAVEGLWENQSPRLLHRLLKMLRVDPSAEVRAAVGASLSRFAYMAEITELNEGDAAVLQDTLLGAILDQRQPLDVRRRSLESAGYFANAAEVRRQIELAYASDEQLLRESALVAMGRSMLPRWLPTIGKELGSPSPALRYEAARAAGEMADEAGALIPKLAPLLNDGDGEVALAATWALGQIGGPTAKRLLQQARKSDDEARRQAADDALEELSLEDGFLA
jgi:HEAT repeat protein